MRGQPVVDTMSKYGVERREKRSGNDYVLGREEELENRRRRGTA